MLAIVHLAVVLVLIKAFRLDRTEAFAALLFGVLIDLDHIFGMVDFVVLEGWSNALNIDAALAADIQWKSMLHNPMAALVVIPATLGFRMYIPAVAWGLHLLCDWVQIEFLGITSLPEMALLAVLAGALTYMEMRDLKDAGKGHGIWDAIKSQVNGYLGEVTRLLGAFKRSPGSPETPL